MAGEVDLGIDELSDFQAVGSGGFSTVFSAWDEGFRRRVAVKVLHSLDDAGRRRFDRERGIMGQLSTHPNVIMPFRAGYTATGAPYLVMELVSGGSLQDLIDQRGQIPWTEAIDYVLPTAAALGHAHEQGILHRDVKPGNVLLADLGPKLTDFGIAAIRESTASQVAYTLSHCPPEAFASGHDARDERSDLYSLASTLYALITGTPPYDVEAPDSQQAYMFRIIDHPVPEVPAALAPAPMRAFLAAALSKDLTERPQTAAEFSAQLRAIRGDPALTGESPQSTGPGVASTGRPWSQGATEVASAPSHDPDLTDDRSADKTAAIPRSALPTSPPQPPISTPHPTSPNQSGPNPGVSNPGVSNPGFSNPGVSNPGISNPGVPNQGGQAWNAAAGGTGTGWPAPQVSQPLGTVSPYTGAHPGVSGPQSISGEQPPTVFSSDLAARPPGTSGPHQPQPTKSKRLPLLLGVGAVLAAVIGIGGWLLLADDDDADSDDEGIAIESSDTTTDSIADDADEPSTTGSEPDNPVPELAWQFETKSSLASKPAVDDGIMVIGAHLTKLVHAVDIETGEEVWSFTTEGSVDANPTIEDGVVYIGSDDGSLYALDLESGEEIWRSPLGDKVRIGAVVLDSIVVVGTEGGGVFGLNRDTGEQIWSDAIADTMLNATPSVAERDGETIVVLGATNGGLYLYDPDTGEQLERIALNGGVWFSRPLVLDRLDGEGQEVWVGTSTADGGLLYRIDLDSGELSDLQTSAGVGTDPALTNDGLIVIGNDLGELLAVDRQTLGELWREGYADQTQIKGSPVVYEDQVIFGTHGRELIAVTASDGVELWRFEGEQIFGLSAPVIEDDLLFVGNDSGTVYQFDL